MLGLVVALSITTYPLFGDHALTPQLDQPQVETAIDKGLTVEMIIGCHPGTAIIIYSKAEHVFCTPRGNCVRELTTAVAQTCAPRR